MRWVCLLVFVVGSGCFTEADFIERCETSMRCLRDQPLPQLDSWQTVSRDLFSGVPVANGDFTLARRRVGFVAGQAEGYASAVLTREGTVIGIPRRRATPGGARIMVMDADGGLRESGLVDRVGTDSWRAAVLADDGFVYAMPSGDDQILRIDPMGLASRVGPVLPGAAKFKGAIVLNDGRIFAVPDMETQALIFDPRDGGLTRLTMSATPVGGIGGTLLSDGRVVFAGTGATPSKSLIYTFDGSGFTSVEVDGSYGRALTLPDGGALFMPRFGSSMRTFPQPGSLPIGELGNAQDRDPRVNTIAWSTQGFAYGQSRYVDIGIVTVGPSGARAQPQDAGTWFFGEFEHLVGLPDGRLVAFPNDPNNDVLELFPVNRRTVPIESIAAPYFNHY